MTDTTAPFTDPKALPPTVDLGLRTQQALTEALGKVGAAVDRDAQGDDARLFSPRAVIVRVASQTFAGCYVAILQQNPVNAGSLSDPRIIIAAAEKFAEALQAQGHI